MNGIGLAKIIISTLIFLFLPSQVFANPIPAFYAFGALDEKRSDTHFDIREYDGKTHNTLKEYLIIGTTIYERDGKTHNTLKEYRKF